MRAVGIKVLKDNLSKYLHYVREGETVYVTDRDKVIAEIHQPTRTDTPGISRWEAFLREGERKGTITRAKPGPPISALRGIGRLPVKIDLQALLDEVKAD